MYLLTAERDESGSSEGSLHGHVCEMNIRGQLELGDEDRWRMWSSLVSVVMASGESVAKLVAKRQAPSEVAKNTCDV